MAVIVFMWALLQGLRANLVRRGLTAQPHIQVLPPDSAWHADRLQAPLQKLKSIDQWPSVLQQLRAMPEVKVASPSVTGSTLVTRGGASRSLSLTAVDLAVYQLIVNLGEKIVHGQARLGASDILIGTELAADLSLSVGDKLLVQSQTLANTAIRFFVALSVAFGIASVLVVSVVQRSKEIGILRAMGISRGQIMRVFLLQGGLLGLCGAALGSAVLHLWLLYAITPEGTPMFIVTLEPSLFMTTLSLATVTGLLAALAPALRQRAWPLWWLSGDEAVMVMPSSNLPHPLPAISGDAPVVRLQGVRKSFNVDTPTEVEVLHGIDVRLIPGEFVAVMGPSDSGKSTLLNIVGLLDRPPQGQLQIQGQEQEQELVPSARPKTSCCPCWACMGYLTAKIEDRARQLIDSVGLTPWCDTPATRLSGGQQQRVAVARALSVQPVLLLADEPSGNLDTKSADSVFELFKQVNREHRTAVLLVTHNPELARRCDRTIQVVDGLVQA